MLAFANCLLLRKSGSHTRHHQPLHTKDSAPIRLMLDLMLGFLSTKLSLSTLARRPRNGTFDAINVVPMWMPRNWLAAATDSVTLAHGIRESAHSIWIFGATQSNHTKNKTNHSLLTQWKSAMGFFPSAPNRKLIYFNFVVVASAFSVFIQKNETMFEIQTAAPKKKNKRNKQQQRHRQRKYAAIVIMTWIVLSLFDFANHAACHTNFERATTATAAAMATATPHYTNNVHAIWIFSLYLRCVRARHCLCEYVRRECVCVCVERVVDVE